MSFLTTRIDQHCFTPLCTYLSTTDMAEGASINVILAPLLFACAHKVWETWHYRIAFPSFATETASEKNLKFVLSLVYLNSSSYTVEKRHYFLLQLESIVNIGLFLNSYTVEKRPYFLLQEVESIVNMIGLFLNSYRKDPISYYKLKVL